MKIHPLADLFPPMTPNEMAALAADIKANGLAQPITTLDGKVLDGRHRLAACDMAGVKPRFTEFSGDNPLAFVLSANLNRRHLTESQRAMVAAKIENIPHGGDRKSSKYQDANLHLNRTEAAETLSVSPRSVATASKLLDEAPNLAKQVAAGEISLNAAKKQLPPQPTRRTPDPDDEPPRVVARHVPPPPAAVVDGTDWPIPSQLIPLWRRGDEAQELLSAISKVRGALRKAQDDKDKLFAEVSFSSALAHLDQAYTDIKTAKPFAVCPVCQGQLPDKCRLCHGRGLISEFRWNTAVPREDKEFRFKAKAKKG